MKRGEEEGGYEMEEREEVGIKRRAQEDEDKDEKEQKEEIPYH